MGVFRCIFDDVPNPAPDCVLGGQGCSDMFLGDTVNGVDVGGVTRLRPVPEFPLISAVTSEDAAGNRSEWPSNEWKRFPETNSTQYLVASCRTRGQDGLPINDIWGCAGVPQQGYNPVYPDEPGNRPDDEYATCQVVAEAGYPTFLTRTCIPKHALYEDWRVTVRTDPEFRRTVFLHDGYCEATNNRQCYGRPWINGNEGLQSGSISWSAWQNIGVTLDQPRIRWHGSRTPLADKRLIDLQNEVLAYLPGPPSFNLSRVYQPTGGGADAWRFNEMDVWRGGFDALAPGGMGCQAIPAIRVFQGRTRAGDCPAFVHWVPLRASFSMSLVMYGAFFPRRPVMFPSVQFHIDVEMGCRIVMGGCVVNEPHMAGPFNVGPEQPCVRSLHHIGLDGDEVVVKIDGRPIDLPRYVRWRGETSPHTAEDGTGLGATLGEGGGWHDVLNLPDAPGSGGFIYPSICGTGQRCSALRGLQDFRVPAKKLNPNGLEIYSGAVILDPNVDGTVTQWCGV